MRGQREATTSVYMLRENAEAAAGGKRLRVWEMRAPHLLFSHPLPFCRVFYMQHDIFLSHTTYIFVLLCCLFPFATCVCLSAYMHVCMNLPGVKWKCT